jgi:tol-pal system protein YbgF
MVLAGPDNTQITMARVARRANTALALIALLTTLIGAALAPASAQELEGPFGMFDRIFSGSERMGGGAGERRAPERTAQYPAQYPSQYPAQYPTQYPAQHGGPDLVMRLERLEAQIRQLTGTIEQLQFRNQQLEGQLRRMHEDTEYRFQELGSKGASRPASQPRPHNVPAPAPPAASPARRGDSFDPAQHPAAPGAPRTLGSIGTGSGPPPGNSGAGDGLVGAPGGRDATDPLDLATVGPPHGAAPAPRHSNAGGAYATLPPSQTPKDEYDLAYGYMLRKDYALAEDTFRGFLSKYPNDRLAGDATYWFGESLFQRQRFRDAAEAFLNVSTKYDSASKAPDALLRLGQSLAALGEKEAACASLGEVLRKFPRASAGVKQGVEREQKRARC